MFDYKSVNIKTSASTPLITKGVFSQNRSKVFRFVPPIIQLECLPFKI